MKLLSDEEQEALVSYLHDVRLGNAEKYETEKWIRKLARRRRKRGTATLVKDDEVPANNLMDN